MVWGISLMGLSEFVILWAQWLGVLLRALDFAGVLVEGFRVLGKLRVLLGEFGVLEKL